MSHKSDQNPATADSLHEITCHIRRSIRYHRARERFFYSWFHLLSFASLLAGLSVVISLLANAPEWVTLMSGVAVAAIQMAERVFLLTAKARLHNGLARDFLWLERQIVVRGDVTEAELRSLREEVLSIEAWDPPVKRYLDLICHNQVARSIGSDDIEPLTFWQRWFAQYLNGDR